MQTENAPKAGPSHLTTVDAANKVSPKYSPWKTRKAGSFEGRKNADPELRHSNSLCRPSGLCEVTLCCLQLLHLSVCSSWLPFGMPSVSYVSFLFISLAFSLHCVFWAFYLLLCILSSLLVGLGSLGCFIFIYSAFVNKACFLFFPFPASCVCACVLKHWYVQLIKLFTIQLLDR